MVPCEHAVLHPSLMCFALFLEISGFWVNLVAIVTWWISQQTFVTFRKGTFPQWAYDSWIWVLHLHSDSLTFQWHMTHMTYAHSLREISTLIILIEVLWYDHPFFKQWISWVFLSLKKYFKARQKKVSSCSKILMWPHSKKAEKVLDERMSTDVAPPKICGFFIPKKKGNLVRTKQAKCQKSTPPPWNLT